MAFKLGSEKRKMNIPGGPTEGMQERRTLVGE